MMSNDDSSQAEGVAVSPHDTDDALLDFSRQDEGFQSLMVHTPGLSSEPVHGEGSDDNDGLLEALGDLEEEDASITYRSGHEVHSEFMHADGVVLVGPALDAGGLVDEDDPFAALGMAMLGGFPSVFSSLEHTDFLERIASDSAVTLRMHDQSWCFSSRGAHGAVSAPKDSQCGSAIEGEE